MPDRTLPRPLPEPRRRGRIRFEEREEFARTRDSELIAGLFPTKRRVSVTGKHDLNTSAADSRSD